MTLATKSKLGWPILILLTVIPAVLWVTAYPMHYRFIGSNSTHSFSQTVNSIGQLLGIIGMAMFALNFVLSMRVRWIEDYFGGMNKVYIAHHIYGGLAFIFLLFHPLFLAARYIPYAGTGTVKLFLLSTDSSINYGVIALGLMIIFLVLTFFVKLPYQLWKFTHKFLSIAFFFGALHVVLIPSDVTSLQGLQFYMWGLIAVGAIGILYRTVLGFMFVPKERFIVEEVRAVSQSIWEITMRNFNGKEFKFTPGQFLFICFPDLHGMEEVHPFSISSQPNGIRVRIAVKALGDFTKRFGELKPGMNAIVEGPFGRSSYQYYPNKNQIWIAGGIGITPFLGMARALKPEDGYKVDLYYSLIDRTDVPFVDELTQLASNNPNLHFIPWYSKEAGFLSADGIIKESGGVIGKEIFLCGPPPMMKSIKTQFKKYLVPTKNVHSEEFSLN